MREHNGLGKSEDFSIMALIPAYNEERFIGSVVLKALKYVDSVIVVDDGSTDATAEIAEAAGALVIRHGRNRGKGMALNTGRRKACELGADVLVILDADGQHLPEDIQQVIMPVCNGEADLVVGSRYLGVPNQIPWHRIFGHRLFNIFINSLSGVALTDSQSGFRAFSRPALQSIAFSSDGFAVESEMQLLARTHGLRVKEVPITIRYQDKPKRSVIQHGLLVLNGFLRQLGQHRPLFYFSAIGLFLMLIAAVLALFVINIFARDQVLAVGYGFISIFFVISGAIAFSTGFILHSIRALLLDWQKKILGK